MQPVGPYQFIEAVSLCQVGSVWSAIDGQGNSYTVAVLDAAVAGDQRWRDAFVGTAQALAQPGSGGPRYVHAEFAAAAPWVAYAASEAGGGERLFAALGMECRPAQEGLGDGESPTMKTATGATTNGSPAPDDDELASPTTRLAPGVPPPNPWQAGPPQPTPVNATPTSAPPHQSSAPPFQSSAPPHQTSAPPDQSSAPPFQSSAPPYQNSAPPYQISVPPDSISGPPQPLPEMPQAAQPYPSDPSANASGYDPLYSPVRHIVPSEPKPRRNRLWIGIAALVVLVLVGGGTIIALAVSGDDPAAPPTAAPQSVSPTPSAVAIPTAPPVAPGKEPPKEVRWPADWPKFDPTFPFHTVELEGLDFPLKAPQAWQCTPAGQAEGYAKYNCGVPPGSGPEIGGELVVRSCTPCDGDTRFRMRRAEEAWGLQWNRAGGAALYAESFQLEGNPDRRYGLVLIGYYRTGTSIDRQVVLRMTSPVDGAGQIRRVANYLRDTLIF
ncbi:hypothetical protein GCM10022225_73820 [Plantactinospora mayteni]|uniref:Uncharacterized protein n=1 Tax=Plantactinospora mayteni TaxID=566021 RepID=A0ABQ4EWA3_9ACTN|nr:hypothetical protein [Plantactinospora mayteni]GIG98960.1 hypothetical protein Pma05_55330 [Plantactinospora mayteni]